MVQASQKAFISHHIKLDFFNNSNLKTDIQNRQSNESEINFQKALRNIQGDNKETKGVNLSEVALLAMAYFFERIFPKNVPTKDAYYTLDSVKGFFDACNHTPFTAIHEVDTTCYKLRDSLLYKHCYLIVQCAWFFNSDHFGSHQYLQYASHYIKTGNQLPLENYRYDKGDLSRKYAKIDENRNTTHHPKGEPAFKFVEQWYYYILYLVAKELELPTDNFKATYKDFREYTPLTKCPRILRAETPFKVIECDIKSAFPSFLDLQTGSSIKNKVYANLMERKNITRSEAKILFNSHLNSGKYKTREQIKSFLIECGYSDTQAEMATMYTNNKQTKFITFMADLEKEAIQDFKKTNNLKTAVRLHDSVLFIDDGTKHLILNAENGLIEFGMEVLKNPVYTNSFGYSDKRLRFAYTSSIPRPTNEYYIKELSYWRKLTKPKVKGESNGFLFYVEKYEYISASFNLNDKYSFEEFVYNCRYMVSTLNYLNDKPISKDQLHMLLSHIRKNSNIIFNVRSLYRELLKVREEIIDVIYEKRDFWLMEKLTFRKKIDFLNALNKARGKVNMEAHLKTIISQFQESIEGGKYEWIRFKIPRKRKNTTLTHVISHNINCLRTGKKKHFDAQTRSWQPLYSNLYKEGVKMQIEHHKKANINRLEQRKIEKYEKDLIAAIHLQTNRKKALQYLHIIGDLLGTIPITDIVRNEAVISEEKKNIADAVGAKTFKRLCKQPKNENIKPITPKLDDFDTSLEHSAFNIEMKEAHERGEQFFREYLKFHKIDTEEKTVKEVIEKKQPTIFPEFDFDE